MTDPPRDEPHWTTTARRRVFDGRTTLMLHDVLLAGGERLTFEVDESIPFAVATLIVSGEGVLLARQYRYPIDRWIYDLPGGGGLVGEEPITAARRELEEELGLVPNDLVPLHTFFSNPGRNTWPVHVFTGSLLSAGTADLGDPAEQVRAAFMPLHELDDLIRSGDVVDPTLLVARAVAGTRGILPPLGLPG